MSLERFELMGRVAKHIALHDHPAMRLFTKQFKKAMLALRLSKLGQVADSRGKSRGAID